MVNSIDNRGAGRVADTASNKSPSAADAKAKQVDEAAPTNPASRDTELVQSSTIKEAEAKIAASDGVDRQKVDAVKEAIRRGEFVIDPDRIAKAFIDMEAVLEAGR